MSKRLSKAFFERRATVDIAKGLLGCVFVREAGDVRMSGVIVETEAYTEEDPAAHSFGGRRTKRNEVMFARAGCLYVYFTYGMHHCLNVVSEEEGRGCAVLIRAVVPLEGIDLMRNNRGDRRDSELTNGPGKVCHAFGITRAHNGTDLIDAPSPLYILDRDYTPAIQCTPRVGISKAQEVLWRFVIDREGKEYYYGK